VSAVIDARLAALEARLTLVEARLASGDGASSSSDSGGAIASDRELDSDWGDPVVKKDPKRWLDQNGDSYAGCKMSECPSDYLKMLASLFDWMADKDEEQKKTYRDRKGNDVPTAPLNRKSASKARGWAKRNAGKAATPALPQRGTGGGGDAPSTAQSDFAATDDDIPFIFDATTNGRWDRP
jgi:hypothetical protein